ncbi:MAG: sulfotransferase domain-containing protein [Gammaproteobacteria bacterium]
MSPSAARFRRTPARTDPKSGNTWMRAFLYNLIERPPRPQPLARLPEYFESEADPRWYLPLLGGRAIGDCGPEDIIPLKQAAQQAIAASRPRGSIFTKTHNRLGSWDGHPLHNLGVMAGAIYLVRNPLDVVLSVADHYGLDMDGAIEFMADERTATPSDDEAVTSVLGSWSGHVESWTAQEHPAICVLRYEDLLDRPLKAFTRAAKLLGLAGDKKAIRRAIEFSAFRVLKGQERQEGFVERSPTSKAFFRKGRKNQWVDELSDEQAAQIVERHYEQMERFGYVPPRFRRD